MKNRYEEGAKIVPCGKCVQCLQRRINGWTFRLNQELKRSTSACFLTLTYETEPLSFNQQPTLDKTDFQKFMKRLRKKIKNSNIKYYACGEYGTQTQRPHYHAIMFNMPQSWINDSVKLHETWSHGHIYIGEAEMASFSYVVGYLNKGRWQPTHELDDRNPEFSLMSKNMGSNYQTPQMERWHKSRLASYATMPGGQKVSLPRYYRDKIFTKAERQILNECAILEREAQFEKLFNNDYKHEVQWKKQTIKKDEKKQRQARQKI